MISTRSSGSELSHGDEHSSTNLNGGGAGAPQWPLQHRKTPLTFSTSEHVLKLKASGWIPP